MRYLATITNFVALGILGFIFFDQQGWDDSEDFWFGVLIFGNIGINLIALRWGVSCGWLGLYFKRKRLEEQQKIEALEK